jgi:hypothetical protein
LSRERTFAIEYRRAEGRYDRFPGLVADLVARKVDLIAARAGAALRTRRQSRDLDDPVVSLGAKLAASPRQERWRFFGKPSLFGTACKLRARLLHAG